MKIVLFVVLCVMFVAACLCVTAEAKRRGIVPPVGQLPDSLGNLPRPFLNRPGAREKLAFNANSWAQFQEVDEKAIVNENRLKSLGERLED